VNFERLERRQLTQFRRDGPSQKVEIELQQCWKEMLDTCTTVAPRARRCCVVCVVYNILTEIFKFTELAWNLCLKVVSLQKNDS
jgi:hypothetical protein